MDDVRDLRGRIGCALVACWFGAGGAIGAYHLAQAVRQLGDGTRAQFNYFMVATMIVGFLVVGTAAGLIHATLRRRTSELPAAIVRRQDHAGPIRRGGGPRDPGGRSREDLG